MALWQFITIIAFIGTLILYARMLASRIGRTNDALMRIEAALLANGGLVVPVTAEAVEAPPHTSKGSESAAYLTIRDLKIKSGQRRPRGARSNGEGAAPAESVDTLSTDGKLPNMTANGGRSETWTAALLESSDAQSTRSDLPSVAASSSNSETPSAAPLESGAALNASGEQPTSSSSAEHSVSDDSGARKVRDALLILSSQRRRRRARQAY